MRKNQKVEALATREILGKPLTIYGTFEEPLFLAKEVVKFIGAKNVSQMLEPIDVDEKGVYFVDTLGGPQKCLCLTEDGLYEVLMLSRKPIAKVFKKKVKRILKEYRRTGVVVSPKVAMALPEAMKEFLTSAINQAVQQAIDERDGNVRRLEREIEDLQRKYEDAMRKIEELLPDAEAYRHWWKAWGDGMSRWRASKADPGQGRLWDDDRELLEEVQQ